MASWEQAPVVPSTPAPRGWAPPTGQGWQAAPVVDAGQTVADAVRGVGQKAGGGFFEDLDGFVRQLASGMTFGLADEAAAAGDALIGRGNHGQTWAERYEKNLAEERTQDRAFAARNPEVAIAGQVAGGVATGGALWPFKAAPTLAGRIGQGAAGGAGMGALAGFGNAEGGLPQRLQAAAGGAVIGAGAGAVAPAVISGGMAAGRMVGGSLANKLGLRSADLLAKARVVQAFQRDGISPLDAARRYEQWQAAGAKPEMLIDLGGENVRGLARAAASFAGAGKETAVARLKERIFDQATRIKGDLEQTLGKAAGFFSTLDDLMKQRSAAAKPLYDQAYAFNGGVVWSDELAELMKRPSLAQAWQKAQAIAADEGVDLPAAFVTDPATGRITRIIRIPDMRTLDYMKRGLDDVVEGVREPITRKITTDAGRAVNEVRRQFLAIIDRLNPAYQEARRSFAGHSASIDALELGKAALKTDAEVTARQVAGLAAGDKLFFKIGAANAIREMVEGVRDFADATRRIFGNRLIRDRIAAAFDNPRDFARFEALMAREANMAEAGAKASPTTGSRTAVLAEEMSDFAEGSGLIDRILRSPDSMRSNIFAALTSPSREMNERVADAVVKLLFNPAVRQNREAMRALLPVLARIQRGEQAKLGAGPGAAGGYVGATGER